MLRGSSVLHSSRQFTPLAAAGPAVSSSSRPNRKQDPNQRQAAPAQQHHARQQQPDQRRRQQQQPQEHQQQQQQQHQRPVSPSAQPGEQEWLAKALAAAGVASRRSCIELVKGGSVRVNGVTVTDPATRVDPGRDELEVAGRRIIRPAGGSSGHQRHYFAVHKPTGFICSAVSQRAPGKRAVDLLQPWLDEWQRQHKGQLPPRLFTVGRLDVATSGLIFITNDGDWANAVIHPSSNVIKEYHVTLPQQPSKQQLDQLKAGVTIDGTLVRPKRVELLNDGAAAAAAATGAAGSPGSRSGGRQQQQRQRQRALLRIDVSEGKKHEVRLLVAGAGLELLALKRVRVGGFLLPRNLAPGGYRKLEPGALKLICK